MLTMYKPGVSENLLPITIKVHPEIADAIDKAFSLHGEGRTQFIRGAIVEKIERYGIALSQEAKLPPNRKGVGGKPTHQKTGSIREVELSAREGRLHSTKPEAGKAASRKRATLREIELGAREAQKRTRPIGERFGPEMEALTFRAILEYQRSDSPMSLSDFVTAKLKTDPEIKRNQNLKKLMSDKEFKAELQKHLHDKIGEALLAEEIPAVPGKGNRRKNQ